MVGERLYTLRTERGMTQEALAAASGIRQTNISRIEKGKIHSPTLDTLEKLAAGLGVGVDKLAGTPTPQPLSEAEWDEFRAALERLPRMEQRTILGLVLRVAAMPPVEE